MGFVKPCFNPRITQNNINDDENGLKQMLIIRIRNKQKKDNILIIPKGFQHHQHTN